MKKKEAVQSGTMLIENSSANSTLNSDLTMSISSTSYAINTWDEWLKDASFNEKEGIIEMIYKRQSKLWLGSSSPEIRIVKRIYGVKDNKLALLKEVNGEYIPPVQTEESYFFD